MSAASEKIFEDRFPSSNGKYSDAKSPASHKVSIRTMSTLASSGARKFFCEHQRQYFPFFLLFIFWLILYFGRTTWGNLINLIPGMSEFHQSRFIVGVHVAGLFLIPIGFTWFV